MYKEDLICVAEKSKILVKEKNKKFFTYISVNNIVKLMAQKKEFYTLDTTFNLNKITKIESIGVQEFYFIKAFTGNQIFIGKDTDIFVDGYWTPAYKVLYHEKIFVYDLVQNIFHETYTTDVKPYRKLKAVKIYAEKEDGIVVNNFTVRFRVLDTNGIVNEGILNTPKVSTAE